jgi:hypothetical protein
MSEKINDGGPAIEISLITSGVALISSQDLDIVANSQWRIGANGYVYRCGGRVKGVQCLLHRVVVGATDRVEVHHINEIKTDCRRENLEVTTASLHQSHHKHALLERNRFLRIYPLTGICKCCGLMFIKNPDHRGRQVCCSKSCAIRLAIVARKENNYGCL